ncbi:MAG: glycosyltransferase family 1 protein [Castellaniella sp.]|uniref:glycosyltransferase family 4 protein n=1 Tax=Castellaniella sp. TaxID=1955812 RepID=UPI001201EDC4|nr:glycosyltransferase family 4 protein [Castellaniella sp.]TAN28459.1 MAG: glycosyltransferase family 1 protein [Castellaniella sp.]
MRILQINLERGWRGGERQTLLTLQGLRAAGHEAELLARSGGVLADRAAASGIPTHVCGGSLGMSRFLLSTCRGYDLWHAQTAQSMSILAVWRPLLRIPVVFTRRTAFAPHGGDRRRRWKWSRADALVAISQAAAHAPRDLGLAVQIIPSAVEPMAPDPARVRSLQDAFSLSGRRVLTTAAALTPEKDPLTLIEAVARVRESIPDVLCLHCGADGSAAAAARARVAALGLQDHYRFVGFQPHVADFLAAAELYVSSSQAEALGTSVLDACLAGLPVVATDVGGHRETLAPDRGLLVQPGDAVALAHKILWVLTHRDVAQAMAQRARAHVAQAYSVPAMVAAYQDLYAALIRARR